MNRPRAPLRKTLSVGLATLTLGLSVAVPVLERGELFSEAAVESEHDPGRCGHKHDHRICAQVGANLAAVVDAHGSRLPHVTLPLTRATDSRFEARGSYVEGPPSRAPPLT